MLLVVFSCRNVQNDDFVDLVYHKISVSNNIKLTTSSGLIISLNDKFQRKLDSLKVDSLEFQIEEYYSISSFVQNDLYTVTDKGEILESFGMFRIRITNPLIPVSDDEKCFVLQLEVQNSNAEVYRYDAIENNKLGTIWTNLTSLDRDTIKNEYINYSYNPETGAVVDSQIMSSNNEEPKIYYKFDLRNNELVNLDAPVFKDKQIANLEIENSVNFDNKTIGVIFTEFNSYIRAMPNAQGKVQINLPINSKFDVISIGQSKDQFYLAKTSTVLSGNNKLLMKPVKAGLNKIHQLLSKY